jgi:LAO/AO transport system kinase
MARPAPEVEAGAEAGFLETLLEGIAAREPRGLGRAISVVERGGAGAEELVGRLRGRTGGARLVGVTGPPGVGKSTLVEGLARLERQAGRTVAVLAVDPTSPFTGGALLGDRLRMQALYTDPGVFIRSMATRGALGGLAAAAHDAVDVLDAAGFDLVLVETVGVGQDEVDAARAVDTVVVVLAPGLGDDVQAAKAGLLEIADLFVVNKADLEGADRAVKGLRTMLAMAGEARGAAGDEPADGAAGERWEVPVLPAAAARGEGLEAVAAAVGAHRRHLEASGALAGRRRQRLALRVEGILHARLLAEAGGRAGLEALVREAEAGAGAEADPYRLADRVFRGLVGRRREEVAP